MYVNKCTKCGTEFETKNPKRVICPGCLYPDRKPLALNSYTETIAGNTQNAAPASDAPKQFQEPQQTGEFQRRPQQGGYGDRRPQQGGYRNHQEGGYRNQQGGGRPHHSGYNQGGYNQGGYNQGGYQDRRPPQGGGFRPQQGGGGFRRPPQGGGGGFRRPPQGGGRPQGRGGFPGRGGPRPGPKKSLLISKEQVEQIERLYRAMLPLPNPDAHEVIGKEINLEPNKVFFGINLVRQKMMLPKLPYPKRKLAVSPDQLMAVQSLYAPLLPLPPIGCHKFIAKQLKMDEWRVHVGIGIIRKQMELPRWNPDREDAPEEFKKQRQEELKAAEADKDKVKE